MFYIYVKNYFNKKFQDISPIKRYEKLQYHFKHDSKDSAEKSLEILKKEYPLREFVILGAGEYSKQEFSDYVNGWLNADAGVLDMDAMKACLHNALVCIEDTDGIEGYKFRRYNREKL